jgi:cyclin-A
MKRQTHIKPYMRTILLDWLVEVAQEFKLQSDTLFLAVNYYDRYLSRVSVVPDQLQLVGVACLWVASKYEEIHPPTSKEFVAMTDGAYTMEQLLQMEEQLLSTLEFRLTTPSAKTFLRKLAQYAPAESNELYYMSCYLLELSMLDVEFVNYLPSMVAASALHLALLMFRWPSWTPDLAAVSHHQPHQFLQCTQRLALLHNSEGAAASKSSVYRKWAAYEHSSVARLPGMQPAMLVEAAQRAHQ